MARTYEPISTQTFSGSQSTLSFTSIPQTYTDLICVVSGGASAAPFIRLNANSTAQYSSTRLLGTGSAEQTGLRARADGAPNDTRMEIGAGVSADIPLNVFHVFNYTNTTTLKTVLCRADGVSSAVSIQAGLYNSTAAITTIEIGNTNSANFDAGSTITLYGILAA